MGAPAAFRRIRVLAGQLSGTYASDVAQGSVRHAPDDDGAKDLKLRWRPLSDDETGGAAPEPLIDPLAERQLFVDDFAVASEKGCSRRVHSPTKCGPCISGSMHSVSCAPQARSSPVWNSELGLWEWWYMGPHGTHYATSGDGERWELPCVGRWEVGGSYENNVACDPAMGGAYSVVRDDEDPDASRRYKGLFGGTYGSGRRRGVSANGFDWTLIGDSETDEIPSQDESQFSYDPYQKRWLALVKLPTEHGRSVWLSQATDFCGDFSTPELIFHADAVDHENAAARVAAHLANPEMLSPPITEEPGQYPAEVYNMAVMPYRGLYIGFPTIYNPIGAIPPPATNSTRINQIELAVSRDALHWERIERDRTSVFIGVEPWNQGNYGCSQLLMAGQPIVRDDLGGEIWCYYNALRAPGSVEQYRQFGDVEELRRLNVNPADLSEDGGALSLAKLRADGFVSVDASMAGELITKPFLWPDREPAVSLFINADASWGEIYVELIDASTGRPFEGFWVPAHPPAPFFGDSTKHCVEWGPDADVVQVRGKIVQVKFYLHQASLFSFWLE
jgi:hypothetical protein